ncbi:MULTISPECIES: SMC-Scp complex subunit ScpB [Prochlorococcus]|uniref:SMC-Scp complex subunit ScpB n=1 Tax=Prochlorococcus TaxID=1218 RepID=UPI000533A866|nr:MULTISPECIES: SMC-Scp complex subunit ScpB [Prochlorococcus]KGG12494.1 putative HTH domain transcriptional regulator [Prochlorococcus sp. MIT 0601]
MQDISLPAKLEAVLYLKGKPLSISEMAEIVEQSEKLIEEALFALMAGYSQRDTALEINEKKGKYSLQLRSGLGELVKNLLPVDMTGATLRTLGTIALKKRILQSELVDLRGSSAYEHIKELVEKDFVERKRQREGRSYWLTLSENFHRTFSVLPDIKSTNDQKVA